MKRKLISAKQILSINFLHIFFIIKILVLIGQTELWSICIGKLSRETPCYYTKSL